MRTLVRDNNQKAQVEDCDYHGKTDYSEISIIYSFSGLIPRSLLQECSIP
jgi:hypothetical protein